MGKIVLFGATGYTGRLVAGALVAGGAAPLLAGRDRDRLDSLSARLGGLETAIADAAGPESLRSLLDRGDVLVSTVGPFALRGEAALGAAVDPGPRIGRPWSRPSGTTSCRATWPERWRCGWLGTGRPASTLDIS